MDENKNNSNKLPVPPLAPTSTNTASSSDNGGEYRDPKTAKYGWGKFYRPPEVEIKDAGTAEVLNYLDPKANITVRQPLDVTKALAEMEKQSQAPNKSQQFMLRTYKNDVAEAIKYGHADSISIALAEQKRRLAEGGTTLSPDSYRQENSFWKTKNILLIIVSLFLILGGVGFVAYQFLGQNESPIAYTFKLNTLIKNDSNREINLDEVDVTKLVSLLKNKIETSADAVGSINNLYLTQTDVAKNKVQLNSLAFLGFTGLTLNGDLARALAPEFEFGYYVAERNIPFLILKTTADNIAFAGMIAWENTIIRTFRNLFFLDKLFEERAIVGTNQRQIVDRTAFRDYILQNRDTRILRDLDNKIAFIYSLADKNTIVITTDERAMTEIFQRLLLAKTGNTR